MKSSYDFLNRIDSLFPFTIQYIWHIIYRRVILNFFSKWITRLLKFMFDLFRIDFRRNLQILQEIILIREFFWILT